MKYLNLLFLLIGTSLFFFSCSEDDSKDAENEQKRTAIIFNGTEQLIKEYNPGTWTPQPNGMLLGEGGVYEYRDESTDPRITGKEMIYCNGLFDTTFSGQFWGTGEFIPDDGGSWDMWLVGERSVTEGSIGEVVAHGKGVLEGLTAQWTFKCLPGETDYTIEGFILEP